VNQFIKQAQKDTGMGTQAVTQAATQQRDFQADVIEIDSADEAEELNVPHPIFELFWQVRSSAYTWSFCLCRWLAVWPCPTGNWACIGLVAHAAMPFAQPRSLYLGNPEHCQIDVGACRGA
jgi:hypothetical protein